VARVSPSFSKADNNMLLRLLFRSVDQLEVLDSLPAVVAEPPDSCRDGCLSPAMLVVGLLLMTLCFGAACMRCRKTRSCTDCSPRRAKQLAMGSLPSP
jgi:hypothetical protein